MALLIYEIFRKNGEKGANKNKGMHQERSRAEPMKLYCMAEGRNSRMTRKTSALIGLLALSCVSANAQQAVSSARKIQSEELDRNPLNRFKEMTLLSLLRLQPKFWEISRVEPSAPSYGKVS
jgi:hypothetical protein